MKKKLLLSILLLLFTLTMSAFAAEIYDVSCTKKGVMLYEGGGSIKGKPDELFQLHFYVSADTYQVLMQASGEPFVVATANKKHNESYSMASVEYTSTTVGTRTFKFFAKGYDGSITPYDKPIYLECYKRESGDADVYSAKCDKDVYQVYENVYNTYTLINIELVTSINTSHIRMTTDGGAVVDNIVDYVAQRGSCDIVDGKKIWKFYMQSTLVGDRTWTFQALDRNKNVGGDAGRIKFKIVEPEYFEENINLPSGPAGAKPGTSEGKTEGDDENATGNEDGVDYGGDGKSDTEINVGSDQKGENIGDTENKDNTQSSQNGNNAQTGTNKPKDEPKEEPKEKPKDEPDEKEETKDKENTSTGSRRIYDKNLWTYEFTGFGNCCLPEDFHSFSVASTTKNIVIEFPDGSRINANDQLDKDLAVRTESRDGKYTFWDIWTKGYDFNELKITVYDKDYNEDHWYTVSETGPFYEKEQRMFDEAVYNEYLLRNFPKKRVITLTINDEYMTIDGEKVEVDPGRGTTPVIVDGRTLLPVRAIVEALGGEIFWTASERKVTVNLFNRVLCFWIDSDTMTWDGIPEKIDVPAQIINDRTMLPIRFLAECLDNTDVEWNQKSKVVTITYKYI